MADKFQFFTALRGFHVYSNTVNWVPYKGQNIIFKREYNNKHDRFAVAGRTPLKGHIGPITVGHVPRELSRYTWFAIQEGAKFEATVEDTKSRPSPLVQGGLEIRIKVKVVWPDVEKLSIYKSKVEEVKYPMDGYYVDDSKEIINELGVHEVEEDYSDDEEPGDLIEASESNYDEDDLQIIG